MKSRHRRRVGQLFVQTGAELADLACCLLRAIAVYGWPAGFCCPSSLLPHHHEKTNLIRNLRVSVLLINCEGHAKAGSRSQASLVDQACEMLHSVLLACLISARRRCLGMPQPAPATSPAARRWLALVAPSSELRSRLWPSRPCARPCGASLVFQHLEKKTKKKTR